MQSELSIWAIRNWAGWLYCQENEEVGCPVPWSASASRSAQISLRSEDVTKLRSTGFLEKGAWLPQRVSRVNKRRQSYESDLLRKGQMKVESMVLVSWTLRERASNSCLISADFSCSSWAMRSLFSVTSFVVGGRTRMRKEG